MPQEAHKSAAESTAQQSAFYVLQAGAAARILADSDPQDVYKNAGAALHSGVLGGGLLQPVSAGSCISWKREMGFPRQVLPDWASSLHVTASLIGHIVLQAGAAGGDLQAAGPKGATQGLREGKQVSLPDRRSERGPCHAGLLQSPSPTHTI